MFRTTTSLGFVCMVLGALGCGPCPPASGPPPASPAAKTAAPPTAASAPQPNAAATPVASDSTPAAEPAAPSEPPPAPVVDPVPQLLDDAGEPLPQTEQRPDPKSASFQRRLELLVEAIAKDEPELALPAFFPVEAYAQVKAIAKPERDWEWRLIGAFKRNIHEYHQRLGGAAADIEFGAIEVPEDKVQWMKPNSEGNRIGYFRVLRSGLLVSKPDGSQEKLEITSLISWRGEWYVVHLHGFK